MKLFKLQALNIRKVWPIVLGIVVLMGLGYYLPKIWQLPPEFFQQMMAGLQRPTEEKEKPEEKLELKEVALEGVEISEGQRRVDGKTYREVAGKAEGITHLARRALKKYLQANPQQFQVTPEHKVYIEDYLAKSLGGRWLMEGEEIEFSTDLIEEALTKAEGLTPAQLQNLSQYSQLVPVLNN